MNERTIKLGKNIGAFLLGIWAVIWFGANKITATILLTATIFVIMLPFSSRKWVTYCRIAFVAVALILVLYNISTTDLIPGADWTGIRFIDQIIHIFNGFVRHVTQ